MRIKRFEAPDTTKALAMVKKEMGENAVILASKKIRQAGTGKMCLEIVAAMDYDLDKLAPSSNDDENTAVPARIKDSASNTQTAKTGKPTLIKGHHMTTGKNRFTPASIPIKPVADDIADTINCEAHDLSVRFASMMKNSKHPVTNETLEPNRRQRNRPNPIDVARWREQLLDSLAINPIEINRQSTPKIIALTGATGVGKTTTAAKLAAWFSLQMGARVTLLSMDCYRIGATDQLRTYARIMRLPCEIALRKKDFNMAINRHQNQDIIIIDTAGKSPFDHAHIDELLDWFLPHPTIEPYLTVSATSKKEDLPTLFNSYKPLDPEGIILTKLDETRSYASLCQQIVSSSLPISCLCTGQRVPEDFLMASKDYLTTLFGQGWEAATNMPQGDTACASWQQ